MKIPFSLLSALLGLLTVTASAAPDGTIAPGKGSFVFFDWAGPALPVWYYAPASLNAKSPVIFVMHGVGRNADEYRDAWVELAEAKKFFLLVPEFPKDGFPNSNSYNFGNVFAKDGTRNPAAVWGYTAIERIFDHVRAVAGLAAKKYSIYGHSAGSQLVHRMPYFFPNNRAERIVAANAGAYMLPDFEHAFPYGLKGSGVSANDLRRALQAPVTILLGEADIDPNHKSLPDAPAAKAQGLHRFARGLNYFKAASEQAVRLGVPFGWKLATAPGIAHDNAGMASFAVPHLLAR